VSNERVTHRMAEVLRHAEAGRPLDTGISGQSAYGGLEATLAALRRRGLLDRMSNITDAGRAALSRIGGTDDRTP